MLPKEMLEQLMELAKMDRARLRASGVMPQSAVDAMTSVVDDKLMSQLVADSRRTNDPGWLPTEKADPEKQRGSGWSPLDPIGPPPGIKIMDQMMDVQDALDRKEREKQFKG
jgi:hypothetical protein